MATLNEVMKETADAIREKTGKSELIKPVDFATEIKGITAGGGESGGELYMKYYDVDAIASSAGVEREVIISAFSQGLGELTFMLASMYNPNANIGGVMPLSATYANFVRRVGILYGLTIAEVDISLEITPEFVASRFEMSLDQFEITKEQFYDLNA
jgi:hypothetical protein